MPPASRSSRSQGIAVFLGLSDRNVGPMGGKALTSDCTLCYQEERNKQECHL